MTARRNRLRVALVGAGQMASHHLRALSSISIPTEIVAVIDPDDKARDALLEVVPSATPYRELEPDRLNSRADVIHICSPPSTHVSLAERALRAGCHVYVEKPFAYALREGKRILALAQSRNLKVCPGHQLLFAEPTFQLMALGDTLGGISHVESFFSFRPSRSGMSTEEQLLDILPHPLYLLLGFFESRAPHCSPDATSIQLSDDGTLHVLVQGGGMIATLVVTLTGRPVDHYLKVVGANGTVTADYVRGVLLRSIGPGSSSIDKALQPFRTARQLSFGSARALSRRVFDRRQGYPGLAELLDRFYSSVVSGQEPPVSAQHILDTVRLFEELACFIERKERRAERGLAPAVRGSPTEPNSSTEFETTVEKVVVTGGTGFLGREVVQHLVEQGSPVRVLSRKQPAWWERVEGVEYRSVDLGGGCPVDLLQGCGSIVHCAAETRGDWDDHHRNSIRATEFLLHSAAAANVFKLVHVSSLAVLRSPQTSKPVREGLELEPEERRRGAYVWGKLKSEQLARELGATLGIRVKVVRPGPVVDHRAPEVPGRLGRRVGNILVAVGPRSAALAVVDLRFAANALSWLTTHFDEAPDELHLLDPRLPTRREMVRLLTNANPDMSVVWIPRLGLRMASSIAVAAQKLLRRGREPIRLHQAFASDIYDTSRIATLADSILRSQVGETRPAAVTPAGETV